MHEFIIKNFIGEADKHNMQHHMLQRTNSQTGSSMRNNGLERERSGSRLERHDSKRSVERMSPHKMDYWRKSIAGKEKKLHALGESVLCDWSCDVFEVRKILNFAI